MSDNDLATAIGVISGTSMDGIDVALVRTDGDRRVETGPGRTYPYAAELRAELLSVIGDPQRAESGDLTSVEEAVSDAHAAAVNAFLDDFGVDCSAVHVVGLHGQTVFHRPEKRFTRQLGLGDRVALATGIDVVNRFRHADVAAGGEGAPLVPLYHRALAADLRQPLIVLNLGGVGNVTYLDGETVVAFDTGPASALLDDFVLKRLGQPFDKDGALAASGTPDDTLVQELLRHPYFGRPAPKSLDRNAFHGWAAAVESLGDRDGAATLAAFTVASAADAVRHVPKSPLRWLVCGGGRLNATFMQGLRERLGVAVDPVESVGWNGDYLEAECFGYLAMRSLKGLPLSLPTTTGVPTPLTGGTYWPKPSGRRTSSASESKLQ